MTRDEAVTLLDQMLLEPASAALEANIRGSAAELVAQIRDHPVSQRWYMGGLIVDVDLDPVTGGRHQARVWVPDVTEGDAFVAQLVVERQLRDALGQHS